MKHLIILILLVSFVCGELNLHISSSSAQQFQPIMVIWEGETQEQFKSGVFQNQLICRNGMLKLVEFNASKAGPQVIEFFYEGIPSINQSQLHIQSRPNQSPLPSIISLTQNSFSLASGCEPLALITNQNYYNQIKISLQLGNSTKYEFSFLINCDRYSRHKKFQYGYLLIGLINAAITIGVALHSRIWSIKIGQKPLRILLTWKLFLLITVVLMVVGITFYFMASKEFKMANQIIKYLGLVVSLVFTFICMNEVLFLFRPFRTVVYATRCYDIRRCQAVSIMFALTLFVISLFVENWILYTFLAGCICVGCIKMFYFNSMQQAFYSLAISVFSVTLIAVVLHFKLPRSYNDYASQLSSPLFIEVPDLVDNLFKKCSWLPVVDIIVPGVFLSFLRTYDENFSTGWGGVYTVIGNVAFLLATTLWIAIEAFYPFSVPFSLITYTFLLLAICVMAFKRNQLKTLWGGYFLQQNYISEGILKENDSRGSDYHQLDQEAMDAIRIRDSFSSKADDDQPQGGNQDLLGSSVSKSALTTRKEKARQSKNQRSPSKKYNAFSSSIR